MQPTDEQAAALDLFLSGENLAVEAGAGTGKALRNDQRVLTPTGWTPICKLQPGDAVIGGSGAVCKVIAVYPQGVRPLFNVRFSDGTVVVADGGHRWATTTRADRQADRGPSVRTTDDIAASLRYPGGWNHWVPMIDSAPALEHKGPRPLDPWLLGVLLGDGGLTSGTPRITNPELDLIERVRDIVGPLGVQLVTSDNLNYRMIGTKRGAGAGSGRTGVVNPLTDVLRTLGLVGCRSPEKVIPNAYLFAPAQDRLELLRGLMDTDGFADGSTIEWSTTSSTMSDQFSFLVQSLRGVTAVAATPCRYRSDCAMITTGQTSYRHYVRLPGEVMPFWLPRKVERVVPRTKYQVRRQIVAVEPAEPAEATCITVDDPDGLFVTEGMVVTHNTTTLTMFASEASGIGAYVAFNRLIVDEAKRKMPSGTSARTLHSHAFGAVGRQFAHRLDGKRMTSSQIAGILGIGSIQVKLGAAAKVLQPGYLAGVTMRALNNFCQSADPAPAKHHFPRLLGIDDPTAGPDRLVNNQAVREYLMPALTKAWADACDPAGVLRYSADRYLKLWQLGEPMIACDFLLFDEAQDVSPVMLSIVEAQAGHAQLVFVGDSNQSIYGWLGAVDAMQNVPAAYRTFLTQSFRFGPALAHLANTVLTDLDADLRLVGNPNVPTRVVLTNGIDDPDVILTRSNATAVATVMRAGIEGRRAHLVGGAGDVMSFAEAALALQQTGSCWHPELACFTSWLEVQSYVTEDALGDELALLVKLVDEFGAAEIIQALQSMPSERDASLVVSTAHKTKGREWSQVKLAGDFSGKPDHMLGDDDIPMSDEEKRLLYVAVTRAQHVVDVSEVAYFGGGRKSKSDENRRGRSI